MTNQINAVFEISVNQILRNNVIARIFEVYTILRVGRDVIIEYGDILGQIEGDTIPVICNSTILYLDVRALFDVYASVD
jgi:hypothetical protein